VDLLAGRADAGASGAAVPAGAEPGAGAGAGTNVELELDAIAEVAAVVSASTLGAAVSLVELLCQCKGCWGRERAETDLPIGGPREVLVRARDLQLVAQKVSAPASDLEAEASLEVVLVLELSLS